MTAIVFWYDFPLLNFIATVPFPCILYNWCLEERDGWVLLSRPARLSEVLSSPHACCLKYVSPLKYLGVLSFLLCVRSGWFPHNFWERIGVAPGWFQLFIWQNLKRRVGLATRLTSFLCLWHMFCFSCQQFCPASVCCRLVVLCL